jgi:hypothetical protein
MNLVTIPQYCSGAHHLACPPPPTPKKNSPDLKKEPVGIVAELDKTGHTPSAATRKVPIKASFNKSYEVSYRISLSSFADLQSHQAYGSWSELGNITPITITCGREP